MTGGGSVLVTGAGSGLGAAIALELGRHGYAITCAGRRRDRIEEVAAAITGRGGAAVAAPLDVTDVDQVERVVAEATQRWGRLDVLVNNAGLFRKAEVVDLADGAWHETVDTNLTGAFYCARAAARIMGTQDLVDAARGHLVNINSGAGLHGYPTGAAYAASKFGLLGLSDTLRQELAGSAIKVTDVIVSAMVESELSTRADVRRLPAATVGKLVLDAVTMPGRAVVNRVDLGQLPPG